MCHCATIQVFVSSTPLMSGRLYLIFENCDLSSEGPVTVNVQMSSQTLSVANKKFSISNLNNGCCMWHQSGVLEHL